MRALLFVAIFPLLASCATGQDAAEAEPGLETAQPYWQQLTQTGADIILEREGGLYLLLEIDPADIAVARLEAMQIDIREAFSARSNRELIEREIPIQIDDTLTIILSKPETQMSEALQRLERLYPNTGQVQTELMTINQNDDRTIQLTIPDAAKSALASDAQSKMMEIVRRRIDPDDVSEISITPLGESRLALEVPGEVDAQRIKDILSQSGRLTFNMADISQSAISAAQSTGRVRPGWELIESSDHGEVLIRMLPELTGSDIATANRGFDQANRPSVDFRLSGAAATKFYKWTRDNSGKYFAIVLDGIALSVPRINEPIPGGNVQITGSFTMEEADDLAAIIQTDALPASVRIIEERIIQPSLED